MAGCRRVVGAGSTAMMQMNVTALMPLHQSFQLADSKSNCREMSPQHVAACGLLIADTIGATYYLNCNKILFKQNGIGYRFARMVTTVVSLAGSCGSQPISKRIAGPG